MNVKRIVTFAGVAASIFALAGCGDTKPSNDQRASPDQVVQFLEMMRLSLKGGPAGKRPPDAAALPGSASPAY